MTQKEHKRRLEQTPVPERLSQWNSGTEMLYICPKCSASLGFFGNKQNYCHICGQKLDWSRSPQYVSQELKAKFDELLVQYHQSSGNITFEKYEEKRKALLLEFFKETIHQNEIKNSSKGG